MKHKGNSFCMTNEGSKINKFEFKNETQSVMRA